MRDDDQYEIDDGVVEEIAQSASSLESRLQAEGPAPAWDALAAALDDYERTTGGTADELLPADTASLAFAGSERAREFVIKALCNQRERVRGPVEAGINGGMLLLVPTLFSVLALPVIAAPVVAVIAATLMARGFDGVCEDAHR